MKKNDILNEDLYIKKLITVIKSNNTLKNKLLTTNGRHSDAFVYIISGICDYRFDDKTEFTAKKGDVIYLPHKAIYNMYIHTDEYRFIFCDFEFSSDEQRKPDLYSFENSKSIEGSFVKLYNTYKSSSLCKLSESMSVLYGIYALIRQNNIEGYLDKSKSTDIESAKRYIDEKFGDIDLSISMLSERLGMSEVYFRKLFKRKYSVTPSKYLILTRLANAKKLMKYPFITLEECALQCGFSSAQYFCRVFKKETGISPGKYKNMI